MLQVQYVQNVVLTRYTKAQNTKATKKNFN